MRAPHSRKARFGQTADLAVAIYDGSVFIGTVIESRRVTAAVA